MTFGSGGAPKRMAKANNLMSDESEEAARPNGLSSGTIELNPLLQWLGLVSEDRCTLPVSTEVRRIVLSPDGGRFLHALTHASKIRVLASLAYLECATADREVGEVVSFLITAPDNQILEQVLAKVEGTGTAIAPRLKAALKASKPLRAYAIGILNRLLSQGCNPKAAVDAASPKRHLRVRSNLHFVHSQDLHTLTRQVIYLCGSEREIIALDQIIHCLALRAPGVLPDEFPMRRLEKLSDLTELLKRRILRHRGDVAVPDVSHPRLEWLDSVPRIRAAGRVFANCLSSNTAYPISLIMGRSFVAIYTCEPKARPPSPADKYVLDIRPTWENGHMVLAVFDAKGPANNEMSGRKLAKALEDLNSVTGWIWRIDFRTAMDDLLLYDWRPVTE